eukprot:4328517-Ditylum_brightwellii.AAC.1
MRCPMAKLPPEPPLPHYNPRSLSLSLNIFQASVIYSINTPGTTPKEKHQVTHKLDISNGLKHSFLLSREVQEVAFLMESTHNK